MPKIQMPNGANEILRRLSENGHKTYIVGGCVRDSLLGLCPHDWDICTDASPPDVISCFPDRRVLETGLKHGTVAVVMDDGQYEVTTFRVDGDYLDGRRPDSVEFVKNLEDDLARRDFTINAMAYNESEGLVDCFCGMSDLAKGRIRCVGNPDDRFSEDALRILRALRFASVYGFDIENDTKRSIHKNKARLDRIAAERIRTELCKLLCGKGILSVLLDYSDVMVTIMPELQPCIGFEQNNRYHQYTVYEHIAHAVDNYKGSDLSVMVALLLHDIGKPYCYTEDENGGHFHGHAVPSRDLAEAVLDRLRFDNKTKDEILELVLYHDAAIEPTPKAVRRWLNKIGERRFYQLLEVRMADILAHAEGTQASRIERCASVSEILSTTLKERQCFSMKDLAVHGRDVLSVGVPQGRLVGDALRYLLDKVINGELENSFEAQMQELRAHLTERQGEWLWLN